MAEIDVTKGALDKLKMAMTADHHTTQHVSPDPSSDRTSPGTTAAIVIGVLASIAIVIAIIVVAFRRKRRHSNGVDRNPLITTSAHYQSVGGSVQE